MKKLFRIFLLSALSAGILQNAEAQRTREMGSSRGSSSAPARSSVQRAAPPRASTQQASAPRMSTTQRVAPQRSVTQGAISRSSSQRPSASNSSITAQRNPGNAARVTPRRNSSSNAVLDRGIASRNGYNSRRGTPNVYSNGTRSVNYRNYSNRYHSHYYGNVYGRRTYFMYGRRYRVIPHSFISIRFGGYPYYYNNGFYYGYYSGYYQPIFPPFGLRISVLPLGYSSIFIGPYPYYYYNGIYYRQYEDSYEVVDAPMGAMVSSLPEGARSVVINGEKLYELNGTYYKADRDEKGNDVFIVVGKNGVINNTPYEGDDNTGLMEAPPPSFQPGDVMTQLPEGSKIVTINGQQMYETPDNIYLSKDSNNGVIQYKVVGK